MATIFITLTVPQLNFEPIRKAAEEAINATVADFEKDYKLSVEHFSARSKPVWIKEPAAWHGNICRGSFGTADANYIRLSTGTTAHKVGAGRLMPFKGWPWKRGMKGSYPPVYQRKSVPGQIKSRPGGPIVGTIQRFAVGPFDIPATQPMHYDKLIADHNRAAFNRRCQDLFKYIKR